jgi:outer membrane translocation and assembly module TamA
VGYVKSFIQASAYRRLDRTGRTVAAGRAEIGVASGFERTAVVIDDDGQPVETVVDDLPANKRFYAGGSTTVRGYQLDRLAVPELLNDDGLPLGGNSVLVFNAELRRALTTLFGSPFGAVAFLDGGNVFPRANDLDLGRLQSSLGFGVRYDSPLGPIRLDFGFKIRPDRAGARPERGWEYHLSIGEAF